jgi:CBS-domain-containing membrane protein
MNKAALMAKYELLKTVQLSAENTFLRASNLPELVYLDDPAFAVMCDFSLLPPRMISADETMDDALNEMKFNGVHLLLVQGKDNNIIGVIGSEDILGEQPIKLIQEKRIKRSQITVRTLMTPVEKIAAFDMKALEHAKVGHIITTLKTLRTHYALVIANHTADGAQILRGIFTTSQISRQLHMDISDAIAKAQHG